jgi:hypothetical protein
MKGTLTGVDWENPHAYFHLDVKGADGKTESWRNGGSLAWGLG